MGKMIELKETSITLQAMREYAKSFINKKTTDAKIFELVRVFSGSALDQNTKLINIGELYWYLIETRNKERAA